MNTRCYHLIMRTTFLMILLVSLINITYAQKDPDQQFPTQFVSFPLDTEMSRPVAISNMQIDVIQPPQAQSVQLYKNGRIWVGSQGASSRGATNYWYR